MGAHVGTAGQRGCEREKERNVDNDSNLYVVISKDGRGAAKRNTEPLSPAFKPNMSSFTAVVYLSYLQRREGIA